MLHPQAFGAVSLHLSGTVTTPLCPADPTVIPQGLPPMLWTHTARPCTRVCLTHTLTRTHQSPGATLRASPIPPHGPYTNCTPLLGWMLTTDPYWCLQSDRLISRRCPGITMWESWNPHQHGQGCFRPGKWHRVWLSTWNQVWSNLGK